MQFKVNKVKIQFPDVEHCCPATLGSLVPIEQLHPPLFTLSGAHQSVRKMIRATLGKSPIWRPIRLNCYYNIQPLLMYNDDICMKGSFWYCNDHIDRCDITFACLIDY